MVVQGFEVFLELKGGVELRIVRMRVEQMGGGTYLAERNERWAGCHIGGLGARVDSAACVCVDCALFDR